ncbi:MAG: class II aldolase/adducin family protein [Acidimicrobiia bacterium]
MGDTQLRRDIAATARMLVAAGLIEAFGHVSARRAGGYAITSTRPLLSATAGDVILLDGNGPVDGPSDRLPLETPMHAAVYEARPDVNAICRGHGPACVVWGTGSEDLPLLHGLGALAGRRVRVHANIDLIATVDAARDVAATLSGGHTLILSTNGALAVGVDLLEAATRLHFLEERARVAVEARSGRVAAAPAADGEWERRLAHTEAEMRRAREWFHQAFGTSPGDPGGGSASGE